MASDATEDLRDSVVPIPFSETQAAVHRSDEQQTSMCALLGISSIESLLDELGFSTESGSVWMAGIREFEAVAGGIDKELSVDRFVVYASRRWGLNQRTAQALFFASDVSGVAGRLDLKEYLLLRAAFLDPPPTDHVALWRVHLRATFHRFSMSNASWDDAGREIARTILQTGQGVPMTEDDVSHWVRHLLVTDRFVARMVATFFTKEHMDAGVSEVEFMKKMVHLSAEGTVGGLLAQSLHKMIDTADGLAESSTAGAGFRTAARAALMDGREKYKRIKVVLSDRAVSTYIPPPDEDAKKANEAKKAGAVSRALLASVQAEEVPQLALNADLVVDDKLRPFGDWRGPLASDWNDSASVKARGVVEAAMTMARELMSEPDKHDRFWMGNGEARVRLLGETEGEQAETALFLCRACQPLLKAEPTLVRVSAPTKVFGDIHGQLREMLLFFGHFGGPTQAGGDILSTKYIFNGDWVDRGAHQLEVVMVLFALKVLFPSHVFLLRGNHEMRHMSEGMGANGFQAHMRKSLPKRGDEVYEEVHNTFDWLPLGALVNSNVLIIHGGLGAGTWGLRDIELVKRPLRTDMPMDRSFRVVLDLLWADPADSDAEMRAGVHCNWVRLGIRNKPPGWTEGRSGSQRSTGGEAGAPGAAAAPAGPPADSKPGEAIIADGGGGMASHSDEEVDSIRFPGPDEPTPTHIDPLELAKTDPAKTDAVLEWGADVTRAFCDREGISLVIRSHQFVPHGYKYMHGGRLITLFSARNYFEATANERPNDGAILLLSPDLNGHLRVHPLRIKHSEQSQTAVLKAMKKQAEEVRSTAPRSSNNSAPPNEQAAENLKEMNKGGCMCLVQ